MPKIFYVLAKHLTHPFRNRHSDPLDIPLLFFFACKETGVTVFKPRCNIEIVTLPTFVKMVTRDRLKKKNLLTSSNSLSVNIVVVASVLATFVLRTFKASWNSQLSFTTKVAISTCRSLKNSSKSSSSSGSCATTFESYSSKGHSWYARFVLISSGSLFQSEVINKRQDFAFHLRRIRFVVVGFLMW